jgi:periplasmic copper chaperone A
VTGVHRERSKEMSDRRLSVALRYRRAATFVASTNFNKQEFGRNIPMFSMKIVMARLLRASRWCCRGQRMPTAPSIWNRGGYRAAACGLIVVAVSWMANGSMARGGEEMLKVVDAWVPATDKVGVDVPLLLTVRNEADAADALLRVRCPVANFSERHTVDRGEGAPAMRMVPSIPIAGGSTTVLKPDGYHVMLLQTRQPLSAGEQFTCSIAFQKAGTIETEVNVRKLP